MAMHSSSPTKPDSPLHAPASDDRSTEAQYLRQELDVLLYAISHDLRAPIRSINGFSRILLENHGGKLDAEGIDCVKTIRAATQRMTQLIEGMTELSRLATVEVFRREVDVGTLAAHVANELRTTSGREVEFAVESGLRAFADPKLLRIALHHLLGNAWKFTAHAPAPRVEFSRAADASGVAFVVRDNGVGFDARYVHKLFKPFQRLHTTEEFPGHGIGLAVVERIVRRHGGRVWAEGVPGQGASFYFSLPSS